MHIALSVGTMNGIDTRTVHHFTVDVEEYFQVTAFESHVSKATWRLYESRVERSVARLLELLSCHSSQATFFVLGWVAERYPHLVKEVAQAGHEIASHGWDHARVSVQTGESFRAAVRRSKGVLEDLLGSRVRGFRAPSFSIVRGAEWALDVLIEEGYDYDSSLFPVRRSGYGYADGRRDPHWILRPKGRLAEIPPATLRRFGVNFPAGGGAYFRLLPYRVVQAALRDSDARGAPATFYIHPWELDPEQPRFAAPLLTTWKHYSGLRRTSARLERLLAEFSFKPIADTVVTMMEAETAVE
jgi:polysaccharide deacetylase family protein (PEP-CTERM system associated)